MVLLFAALIAPFFINWDSYRANFEHEATRILGHPVHVGGAAHVSILPSPSVTFTDVEVGDPSAAPLMTIDRFSATLELVPLLQGQLHVVSMLLEHPMVHVSAGPGGAIDWMQRLADTQGLNPDRVSLADVRIEGGSLAFRDAGTGVALAFDQVTADISATSLAGPWRADGTYVKDGTAVPFHFATGRRLDDGTIRLQAQVSPAELPVAVTADGVLAVDQAQGVTYTGTYSFASANDAAAASGGGAPSDTSTAGSVAAPSGWSSDGSFTLSREKLVIDKAVLSEGPADRATSIAGSLTVGFGVSARFDATGTASQLDLDSALGGGPAAPVNVSAATGQFLAWLSSLPVLPIPGRIAINVPAIIVGGSVVQGVDFAVEPDASGWKVEGLSADLPGQAYIEADGVLATGKQAGFSGHARLAVSQPAAFAAWWRGSDATSGGAVLPAFDVAGDTQIRPGRISLDNINAVIGDADITGRFAWSESTRDHSRHLGTDLKANRVDVDQLRALVSLIAGREVADATAIADSYSIILATDELNYGGVALKGVAVNANYSGDVLNIVQFAVGDLGGASFKVTGGRIDSLTTGPRGHLDAHVEAMSFDGLSAVAAKLIPGSGLSDWLARTGPALTPAVLDVRVSGPAGQGQTGFSLGLKGVAGETTVDATVGTDARTLADWRSAAANLAVTLDSPDTPALAKQFGLIATSAAGDPGTHLALSGKGAPETGLDATFDAELPGLAISGKGAITVASDWVPAYAGTFAAKSDDLAPFLAATGLSIPTTSGASATAAGNLTTSGSSASFDWRDGTLAGHTVAGKLAVARAADAAWRVNGSLATDQVDLNWLTALSLGSGVLPTGDPKSPWPKTGYAAPAYGPVSGRIEIAPDHLAVGGLDVTGSTLSIALTPQRMDVDVKGGRLAGGMASGGVSIQNVDGNAHLSGQFSLAGATLDSLAWQRDGRVVATGTVDLSGNFETTGRSASALVSSMTGGGVIAVHNGVARYLNPNTVGAIIRVSDLGDPISQDQLRADVEAQIDGDQFAFGEAGGAFAIAGGTLRMTGLSARGPAMAATGSATVDLNAMTIDSDWTLAFPVADATADAGDADVGLVFRGPLVAPSRTIDVVPLNAYLNARQAARMLDVIATEEADRAEHQRFVQFIAKIKDDEAAAERARQAAEEAARRREQAEADAIANVAAAHVAREIATDTTRLASLRRGAALAMDAAKAAQKDADALAADATAKGAAADSAATTLAQAAAADDQAAIQVQKTAQQLAQAQATAATTTAAAQQSRATADAARQQADAAAKKRADAQAAFDAANKAQATATAKASAADRTVADAQTALDAANRDVAAAQSGATAAAAELARATAARTTAQGNYDVAETGIASLRAAADHAASAADRASNGAMQADAERAQRTMVASQAGTDAANAEGTRARAETDYNEANSALLSATAALASAQASDPSGAGPDVQGKKASVELAQSQLDTAARDRASAEAAASNAADHASMAKAAADAANAQSQIAAAAATQAAIAKSVAAAALADKQSALDSAQQSLTTANGDMARGQQALAKAQSDLDQANANARAAQAVMDKALRDQSAVPPPAALADIAALTGALQKATDDANTAAAAAASAGQIADSAAAAALAAADAVAGVASAHDTAVAATQVTQAARAAADSAAKAAAAAAADAKAKADAAAAIAKQLAADAAATAARVPDNAVAPAPSPQPAPPPPRPRPKPAANAPLSLVPAQ